MSRTDRGILVLKCFEIAFHNSGDYYDIVDPCAIAVAFCPEVVTEFYQKPIFIETEGKYSRGMVVINWIGRGYEKRCDSNIISAINLNAVVDMLIESVYD